MAGKFEVYKDKAGKFRFRLKSGNGEIIAVGEAYESKTSAMHGIESIRSNAEAASLVDFISSLATGGEFTAASSLNESDPVSVPSSIRTVTV